MTDTVATTPIFFIYKIKYYVVALLRDVVGIAKCAIGSVTKVSRQFPEEAKCAVPFVGCPL